MPTKRALVTFGNPFGLALYDPEREGLHGRSGTRRQRPLVWQLRLPTGTESFKDPGTFCTELRRAIAAATTDEAIETLELLNRSTLDRLRIIAPTLTDGQGHHYVDLLARLIAEHRQHLAEAASTAKPAETSPIPVDEPLAARIIDRPQRIRDREHLAFIARQPCLVCGRIPVQVHHLTFAQPKALGRKSGDQWTVPLCALHHRDLHDAGDERVWWQRREIEAVATAERLWRERLDRAGRNVSAA